MGELVNEATIRESESIFIPDHDGAVLSIELTYAKLWACECDSYASLFDCTWCM